MLRTLTLSTICCFLALAVWAQEPPDKRAAKIEVGQKIDNLPLTSLDGKKLGLHDFKDRQAVVVIFLTFECPVATSYLAELTELAKTYEKVDFLGVCPSTDAAADLARQAKEFELGFQVVHDPKLHIANAFQARTTPEVFVLDAGFVVRYRGRIDDAYTARLKKNKEVTHRDLKQALDEVLAGKDVSQPTTVAIGCPIVRGDARKISTKLTYYKDVLPILQSRCQTCHRPGEIGPFSLMPYPQAVNWADDIKEYTQSRRMPPWKPVVSVPFHSERKMTDVEIATVADWVNGGTPEGNPGDAPPPPKFTEGWVLGKPDMILTPPDDFTLGATGPDIFRCFVFSLNLPEDSFLAAYEVHPGNRRVVHHTLHFLDTRSRASKLQQREMDRPKKDGERDFGPGYGGNMGFPGFFPPSGEAGAWAPGVSPQFLPDDVGFFLPKASDFVFQIHYHRTGKVEKDRTQIGLYFSKNPKCKPIQPLIIPGVFVTIPSGNDNFPVKGTAYAAQDCTLHYVAPHMHLIGKSIKVTMTPPNEQTTTLIDIKEWDFNWQEIYMFQEPIKVKKNTRFDVEAVYDNSKENLLNPFNPPRQIYLGENTNNEMCFGFIGATQEAPGALGVRLFWPDGPVLKSLSELPKKKSVRLAEPDLQRE